jgi:hypothetical protein
MRKLKTFFLLICFFSIVQSIYGNTTDVPKEVVITNKEGASFSIGKLRDFRKATVKIPFQHKLQVLDYERVSTAGGEEDEIVWYYYKVKYNKNIGWIKGEDTDSPQKSHSEPF